MYWMFKLTETFHKEKRMKNEKIESLLKQHEKLHTVMAIKKIFCIQICQSENHASSFAKNKIHEISITAARRHVFSRSAPTHPVNPIMDVTVPVIKEIYTKIQYRLKPTRTLRLHDLAIFRRRY